MNLATQLAVKELRKLKCLVQFINTSSNIWFKISPLTLVVKEQKHREANISHSKGLFTWRWGIPGGWGNPPNRGQKIKRVYMQSHHPGVLRWGFLRLWLRLQLRSLSRGVPSSHLEKTGRLILGHKRIYSWKRHALCYVVFGFTRNRWLSTLYGIVWETKYGRFTALNIPKCEHFTLLVCPLRFLGISAIHVSLFHERDPG